MQKKITLLFLIAILFTSCSRIPFTIKKPASGSALVYIYSLSNSNVTGSDLSASYKLYINGVGTKGDFKDYEHIYLDFNPVNVTLTVARNYLERKNISLNLEAERIYYFRVNSESNEFGKFNFSQVEEEIALNELKETNVAGKYVKNDNMLSKLIQSSSSDNPDNLQKLQTQNPTMSIEQINALIDKKVAERTSGTTPVTQMTPSSTRTGSKLDDIRNAYEMKKQGLLTDEEFKAMKAEILAK